MVDYDLIIIGCGPGGMNACLYASRANLKTLVIEKNCPGGKVVRTNMIENWLGNEKISGVDLSLQMFKHAFSYGGVYEQGNVLDIVDYGEYKEVVLKSKTYRCYSVIIAIGTSEKKLGIPGEDKYYGKGVSYCAICDAGLHKNEVMVVMGNGKYALEETLYLTKFAKKIYLINEKNRFDAEQSLIEKVKDNDMVEILYNYEIVSINGDDVVKEVVVRNEKGEEKIETSIVFPFLGDSPDTKFGERLKLTDEKGYIEVDERKRTKIEGIYAIGDCTSTPLKQIITASSDGALAAVDAYKYVRTKKGKN